MTVSTTENRTVYKGNGSTTVFSTSFEFLEDSDLVVTHIVRDVDEVVTAQNVLTLGSDYTVSGGDGSTGSVTLTSVTPDSTDLLVLERQVAYTQGIDYVPNDPFPAEVAEQGYDRLTYLVQQVLDLAQRSIRLDIASDSTENLPDASLRANKFLSFDSNGKPTAIASTDGTPTQASAITYLAGYTGADPVVLSAELDRRRIITPHAFGTYTPDDSSVDNGPAINTAIEALKATGRGGDILLGTGDIYIGTEINMEDAHGIRLIGCGQGKQQQSRSDEQVATRLIAQSGYTGNVVRVGPPDTGGTYNTAAPGLLNLCIDGNATAAKCLYTVNIRYGEFRNLYLRSATSVLWDWYAVSVSGEGDFNSQHNSVDNIQFRVQEPGTRSAKLLRLDSPFGGSDSPSGNISANSFTNIFMYMWDGNGIEFVNTDHNVVDFVRFFTPNGTSGIHLVLGADNDGDEKHARFNSFHNFMPEQPSTPKTWVQSLRGDGTRPAEQNIVHLVAGNGAERGLFNVQNGSTLFWTWNIVSKVLAYKAGGQSLSSGASNVVITFDTVTFDAHLDWDTANDKFVAPVTGYYRVSVRLALTSAGSGDNWTFNTAITDVSASSTTRRRYIWEAPNNQAQSIMFSHFVYLEYQDEIQIDASQNSGSTGLSIFGGVDDSVIEIELVQ